jgi:hypothetical protein
LACYAYRSSLAWLISFPIAAELGSAVSSFPEGDRLLFEPGALYLAESLRDRASALTAMATGTSTAILLGAFLGLVPLWWLMLTLRSADSPPLGALSARRQLAGFALLGAGMWIARVLSLLALGSLALSVHGVLEHSRDERLAELSLAAVACVGLMLWLVASVWHDLARSLLLRRDDGVFAAAGLAWRAAGRGLRGRLRTLGCHAGLNLASLALLAGAAALVGWLDVHRPGALRVVACLAVHQLAILGVLFIRAVWLRIAAARAEEAALLDR